MRHGKFGRILGRKTNHRIALRRNMAVALFTHGQITTTLPKAKALRPFVERLISAAKKGDLASRRRVIRLLGQDHLMLTSEDAQGVERNVYGEIATKGGRKQAPRVVKHLFEEIAPRYADRDGGYTRIIKLAKHRIGDGSDLCVMQLVGEEDGPQVAGDYSRRREKANRRMEFAAKRRKAGKGQASDTADTAEEATATATLEPGDAEASAQATAEATPDAAPEATPESPEAPAEDKKDA